MLKICPECHIAKSKFNSNGYCSECDNDRQRMDYAMQKEHLDPDEFWVRHELKRRSEERAALALAHEQRLSDPDPFPKDVFSRDLKPLKRRWNTY